VSDEHQHQDHEHGGHEHHDHDHGHEHPEPQHQGRQKSTAELRTAALEAELVERGLVSTDAVDTLVDLFENEIGPRNGARVVAKAWADPDFRERLLSNASEACAELGYGGLEGAQLVALANEPGVHNVVVCTLCSCYPWPILGVPPVWYKSAPYRSRVVREPRAVLAEFGLELAADTEVRVWDSSADMRYLVIPERPAGTEQLGEAELTELVTRNGMIGVAAL
jgi:nitrile hydratase subunit alpha